MATNFETNFNIHGDTSFIASSLPGVNEGDETFEEFLDLAKNKLGPITTEEHLNKELNAPQQSAASATISDSTSVSTTNNINQSAVPFINETLTLDRLESLNKLANDSILEQGIAF